jgi:arsenite-transporting ATPase
VSPGDDLTARLAPVTLVVGKGGVGKTTLAASLATRFATRGARTLVVTTDPAATLFSALDRPIERTASPVAVIPGSLDAWAFDTTAVRDRFLATWREPITRILDRGTYLDTDDIHGLVEATLPGADEIFAVLALGEILGRSGEEAYERIVIDTAPTGHTLRLLNLPRSFAALVRLLDAMQEKHRFMVRALTHRYRKDAADALIAELRGRVETLQTILGDPTRTAAVLVVRPEPVVVAESERYFGALRLSGISVAAILINTWTDSEAERQAIDPIEAAAGETPLFTAPRVHSPSIETLLDSVDLLKPAAAKKKKEKTKLALSEANGWPSAPSVPSVARVIQPAGPQQLARSITIVGGKGGVGKTTVACAIAIAVADAGNPTLLVSTDPAPSVGDALDLTVGDDEVAVPGVPGLIARQMDATRAFTAFRDLYQTRIDDLFESLTGRGMDIAHDREIIRDLFSLAPPGIDELYALTVLGETLEEGRYSHIIIDPAPTGHLLRLLDMPALAIAWSHELMRMMLKYKEVVGLGEAAQDLLAFAKRTRLLETRMRDAGRSAAVLVTLDEPLVRGETARLLAALHERSLAVSGVVWNRASSSVPPLPTGAPVPQLLAPLAEPAPVGVDAIRNWSGRWGTLRAH